MSLNTRRSKLKYIKKITPDDFNNAFYEYLGVASKEDLWEVNGAYARPSFLCYATVDDNCYYCLETERNNNFVYFAFEKNKLINMKGLWESIYQMVCEGRPYIRFSGYAGRYGKILKGFGHYWETHDANNPTYQAYMCYVAHPEIIKKLEKRINK